MGLTARRIICCHNGSGKVRGTEARGRQPPSTAAIIPKAHAGTPLRDAVVHLQLEAILNSVDTVRDLVETLPGHAASPSVRARTLATALRSLWPHSSLYFTLIAEEPGLHVAVVDGAGRPAPHLGETIKIALGGAGRGPGCFPLPPRMSLDGRILVSHEITHGGVHWGHFGLALWEHDSPEISALVQSVLALCARALAGRLHLHAQESGLARAREQLVRQTALADVGELAGPLAHEFNNFLNVLLLQVTVLTPALPEAARGELEKVRRQGRAAGGLVREWQRYRQQARPASRPVVLNESIREVVDELRRQTQRDGGGSAGDAEGSLTIVTRLAADLPAVTVCPHDLRRVLMFLLRNAVAAAGNRGVVSIETEVADGKVHLHIKDSGPAVAPEALAGLFDLQTARGGANRLELAACASIARRHRGKLQAENNPGGVAVTLALPAAASDTRAGGADPPSPG